jgi:polysaccharide export outer membrane protein
MPKRFLATAAIMSLAACAAQPPQPSEFLRDQEQHSIENSVTYAETNYRSTDKQLDDLRSLLAEFSPQFSLGRGDILSIAVYDEPDLSLEAVPIRPDGYISFPLIGDVRAAGLDVEELNQEITRLLGEYLLEPRVSVVVMEFNSLDYTIDGEVVHPGVYPLSSEVSLTKAVASAGGFNKGQYRASTIELADLEHAFIARENKPLPVDFVRLFRDGDLRFDIALQPGDYIRIPSGLSQEVYVLGEVNEPMLFAYRENMPMSRILAQAEGMTPDADQSRIHIVRGALHNPTVIVVDFQKVVLGQAMDVQLEPGDIVYVPATGLTDWSRMMDKILPSIQTIWTGFLVHDALND